MKLRSVLALLLMLALHPHRAAAQDANYWSIQYGPIGQLIGGVMIAGARDLSATYYNPGGLALTADPTFLISVNALQEESLKIRTRGVPAAALDLQAGRWFTAPSLVAGNVPWSGPDWRLAWSYLPRQNSDFFVDERKVVNRNATLLASEAVLQEKSGDSWFGATWSRRIPEGIGYGASGYLAYRSHRYRSEWNAQRDSTGANATALSVNNTRFSHYRLLAKLGVAADRGPLQLGLTLTTPSLGLFGSGDIGFTRSLTGIDLDGDQSPDNFLVSGFENDLDADYRSSWAIGIGGSWLLNKTRLHASGEWFASVEGNIIETPPIDPGGGFEDIVINLDQYQKSVFNFGFGIEHALSATTSLYGAFAVDRSSYSEETDPRLAISSWDLYHLTFGGETRAFGNRFTGGIAYAWGSDEQRNLLVPPVPDQPPIIEISGIDLDYSRLTLMVGVALGTGDNEPKSGQK